MPAVPLHLGDLSRPRPELPAAPTVRDLVLDLAGAAPRVPADDAIRDQAARVRVRPDPDQLAAKRAAAASAPVVSHRPAFDVDSRPAGGMTVPKLEALTRDTAKVSIPFGPEKLTVEYRPGALTSALIAQLTNVDPEAEMAAAVLEPMSRLLVSWDLLYDDERPIPTTVDGLKRVPLTVLTTVAEAVAGAIATPVARAKQDAAGRGRRN